MPCTCRTLANALKLIALIFALLLSCQKPQDVLHRLQSFNAHATVVCDGKGGFAPKLFASIFKAECNEMICCAIKHERKHIEFLQLHFPEICKGKAQGVRAIIPGEKFYVLDQLRITECEAYAVSLHCLIAKYNATGNVCLLEQIANSHKMLTEVLKCNQKLGK